MADRDDIADAIANFRKRQDARDFSACALALPNNAAPNPFSCGGSGTSGVSRFIVGSGNPVNGPGNGDFALDPSGGPE